MSLTEGFKILDREESLETFLHPKTPTYGLLDKYINNQNNKFSIIQTRSNKNLYTKSSESISFLTDNIKSLNIKEYINTFCQDSYSKLLLMEYFPHIRNLSLTDQMQRNSKEKLSDCKSECQRTDSLSHKYHYFFQCNKEIKSIILLLVIITAYILIISYVN
jgi:hypothetical protein